MFARQSSPRTTLISRIKLFAADERRDTRIYLEFVIPSAARNPLWFLITQTKKHRGKRKTILANGEAPKGRRICSPEPVPSAVEGTPPQNAGDDDAASEHFHEHRDPETKSATTRNATR